MFSGFFSGIGFGGYGVPGAYPDAIVRTELLSGSAYGSPALPPPIETVRTFFPETWIWDLVEVG